MAEQDVSSAWVTFSPERRAALLAKMSPDQKKNLRTYLEQKGHTAEPAAPAWQAMDEKAPENARFPKLGATGYKAADFIGKLLPGAGAAIGGANVELGPAAIGAAAVGGITGDRAQHAINTLLYKDQAKETGMEALTSMGEQGALGAAGELGARGVGGALKALARPFGKSAETVAAAEAGKGVRLTPGEASGSSFMQRGETVLEHLLPGGGKPLEHFRVAQAGDVERTLEEQLNSLSTRGLSPEAVGKQVQSVVKQAEESQIQSQGAYGDVKKMLGLKPSASKAEIETAIAQGRKPSSILDPSGRPVHQGSSMTAATGKLAEADRLFYAEQNRIQTDIVGKILKTQKPEIIGTYFETAGLNDLRSMQKALPPEVKQDVARNVLENMLSRGTDAQSGQVGARSLATGLKKLGEGRGRLIFGAQYDAIRDASALMNRIATTPNSTMMGRMHAARMMGSAAVALGGLLGLGGLEHAVETLGAETVFARMASLALTRPQTTAKALNVIRAVAVSAARGAPFAADQFETSPAKYGTQSDISNFQSTGATQ